MENAVKALSMAGSVLLSLLIIGLLVFGYNTMRTNENAKIKRREEQEIRTINTQFETYLAKKYLIGSEVLSVANLATDYNGIDYLNEGYEHIDVTVKLKDISKKLYYDGTRPALFSQKEFKTIFNSDNGTYSVRNI
jgi:amino acid permease